MDNRLSMPNQPRRSHQGNKWKVSGLSRWWSAVSLDNGLVFLDDGLVFLDDGLVFLDDGLVFLDDGLVCLE